MTTTMNELKNQIIEKLTELPQTLLKQATELLDLKNSVEELKFKVDNAEIKIMQEVEALINVEGKPIFSNITKRQVETSRILTGNDEHQHTILKMNEIKTKIDNLTLQHRFCWNKFMAANSISKLIGGDSND